jgi:hypothetical protein
MPHIDGSESGFYRAKINTARFFFQRLLPQVDALATGIEAGGQSVREFAEVAF